MKGASHNPVMITRRLFYVVNTYKITLGYQVVDLIKFI